MTEKTTCKKCGSDLPPNAPAGVCPRCLLQAGLLESSPEASAATDATILTDSTAPSDRTNDLPTASSKTIPEPGEKIRYFGEYELLSEIARGGMGVVYRARQVRLNRIVALKMILAGQFASPVDVQRFHTEAEAAAQLDHPGIVPIYEVGEYEGHHFFTMGFVEGGSLAARLKDGPIAPRDTVPLVLQVAEAVQYAHEKGVIHRDLKPANILLDHNTVPRITDFGLAKNVNRDSGLTATGQVMGTPSYMPPEQASGNIAEVKEAADVYSLGAILYALLTGRPPFQADNALDTLMQVLEREPVSLRQLNPKIPRDLETICLKCLEKDPRRRYPGARQLAADLQRYLIHEPIQARRATAAERVSKWGRRHPVWATLVGVIVVGVVIALSSAAWYVRDLRDRHVQSLLQQAHLTRLSGDVDGAYTLVREAAQSRHDLAVRQVAVEAVVSPHSRPVFSLPFGFRVIGAAFSTDGRRLVAAGIVKQDLPQGAGNTIAKETVKKPDLVTLSADLPPGNAGVKVWDIHSGTLLGELAWDESGRIMPAVNSAGDLLAVPQVGGAIALWSPDTGKVVMQLPETAPLMSPLAFSSDGQWLAVADPQNLHVWNCRTGELERKRSTATFLCFAGHDAIWVRERAGAGGANDWEGRLARWRLDNDSVETFGPEDAIPLALSGDGRRAALRQLTNGQLDIYDLATGQRLTELSTVGRVFAMVKFSADGNRFAVQLPMEEPDSLRIYEVSNGTGLTQEHPLYQRTISEPLLRLVRPSAETDSRHAREFDERSPFADLGIEFVGDRPLLANSTAQRLSVTNVRTGEVSRLAPNGTDGLAVWTADGSQFAFVRHGMFQTYANGSVFCQVDRDRIVQFAGPPQPGGRPPTGGAVSSSGGSILEIRDLVQCTESADFSGESLSFVLNGEMLVSTHQLWRVRRNDGRLRLEPYLAAFPYDHIRSVVADEVWSTQIDTESSRLLLKKLHPSAREIAVPISRGSSPRVAFSSDARRAFVASLSSLETPPAGGEPRMVYQLWDLAAADRPEAEWVPAGEAYNARGNCGPAAFSPDGCILASAAFASNGIELWDVATHKPLRWLTDPENQLYYNLAFTPNGRHLVANGSHPGFSVWDLSSGSHHTIGKDLSLSSAFAVSADGRTLAASDTKSVLHLWSLPDGKELARWYGGSSVGTAIAFHPDGTLLVTCGGGRMSDVRFWDLAAIRVKLEELGLDW